MKFTKIIPGIMTALLAALCVPSNALADDATITLGLAPAISQVKINPGQNLAQSITVINKETAPVAVRVYAQNFEAADRNGALKFNTDATKQYASSTWISFEKTNLVLGPASETTLHFTINCPPGAEPGGHYSTIFFEPLALASTPGNSHLGISQRVGALQFITVAGNDTEQGQVLGANNQSICAGLQCSFKTAALREWGPVPFTFTFTNTGNIHVKVHGSITIANAFGQTVAELPVPEKTVLPGSQRDFEVTWLREALFGPYTAKLNLIYGERGNAATAHTGFWVLPWRALMGGLSILILAGFGYIVLRRRNQRTRKHTKP